MSKFEIKYSSDKQYHYRLKAGNNEIILSGERYTTKQACQNGIASVKANAPYDSRYEKRVSSNNYPYFVLKASNGEIIGVSELYSSTSNRDQGIEAVKYNAPIATVEDLTFTSSTV